MIQHFLIASKNQVNEKQVLLVDFRITLNSSFHTLWLERDKLSEFLVPTRINLIDLRSS